MSNFPHEPSNLPVSDPTSTQLAADVAIPGTVEFLTEYADRLENVKGYPVHAQEIRRLLAHADALVARVTDLEARNEKLSALIMEQEADYRERARAAEAQVAGCSEALADANRDYGARLDEAEAQVAALTQDKVKLHDWGSEWKTRAVAAETALATTRQALAEIIDRHERPCGVHESPLPCDVALAETYAIARRALAATEEPFDGRTLHPRPGDPAYDEVAKDLPRYTGDQLAEAFQRGKKEGARESLTEIKEAAIKYGVNDEVGAAIAHAEVVQRVTKGEQ